jgi:FMN-dependent NADH-azoreductase
MSDGAASGTDGRTILRVDAGIPHRDSVSRHLADDLMGRLLTDGDVVVRRDVSGGLPFVDVAWHAAVFADGDASVLQLSEELIAELRSADELVLVAPVYNLGVPATLKAWIDQVVRAGLTFRMTPDGAVGLLKARRAWIVTASGGTSIGSPLDFNTTYLRAILGLVGIRDVRVVAADSLRQWGEEAIHRARRDLADALDDVRDDGRDDRAPAPY